LFKDFSIRKLLHDRKFAISISLIIAFVFWVIIVIDQNPEREQTFSNLPIEVNTSGTIWGQQGLEVVSEINQTATVTVFGPNYIVSSLKSSDIKIVGDLSSIDGSGTYNITLSAVRASNQSVYSFVSISPSIISVKFDYFDEKKFAVLPVVEGFGRIEGLTYDDEVVTNSEQSEIVIKGPRSEVSKIASVVAYAKTDKTLETTTAFDAKIKLLDNDGAELDISKYTLTVEKISVSVPVSKTKEFKFKPTFTAAPNSNVIAILEKSWKADLDTFTVAGPPEVIDNLDAIQFESIDVTKISSKNSRNVFEVKPILPNGVRITDGIESATVTLNLKDFTSRRVKIVNFEHGNTLSEGLTALFGKNIYVEVCGKREVLNSLDEKDFYLSMDLTDIGVGDYLINATLKTYDNYPVWQIVPCEISVKIK
jgi:YbbR domain-containing protein